MFEGSTDLNYDAVFAETQGGLGYVFAGVGGLVTIALFATDHPVGGAVALMLTLITAILARASMRRADALHERALAAEKAEGDDSTQLAEAA